MSSRYPLSNTLPLRQSRRGGTTCRLEQRRFAPCEKCAIALDTHEGEYMKYKFRKSSIFAVAGSIAMAVAGIICVPGTAFALQSGTFCGNWSANSGPAVLSCIERSGTQVRPVTYVRNTTSPATVTHHLVDEKGMGMPVVGCVSVVAGAQAVACFGPFTNPAGGLYLNRSQMTLSNGKFYTASSPWA